MTRRPNGLLEAAMPRGLHLRRPTSSQSAAHLFKDVEQDALGINAPRPSRPPGAGNLTDANVLSPPVWSPTTSARRDGRWAEIE